MFERLTVLLLAVQSVVAVRRIDLTASEGEVAGKYAFAGGEEEGTCKACKAVMEHIDRQMAKPMWDEGGHFGGRKSVVRGSRKEQAERLNRVSKVQTVLDPTKCQFEMKGYDLAYIRGENTFHYKGDPNDPNPGNYPVHMELNDWAKQELAMFCESVMEEKEEELAAAVLASLEEGGKPLGQAMCAEELDLCKPPPPPPPPEKQKKLPKAERLKKAREVFDSFDTNPTDGVIDRREIQGKCMREQPAHGHSTQRTRTHARHS